jgi:hypothetical protein
MLGLKRKKVEQSNVGVASQNAVYFGVLWDGRRRRFYFNLRRLKNQDPKSAKWQTVFGEVCKVRYNKGKGR